MILHDASMNRMVVGALAVSVAAMTGCASQRPLPPAPVCNYVPTRNGGDYACSDGAKLSIVERSAGAYAASYSFVPPGYSGMSNDIVRLLQQAAASVCDKQRKQPGIDQVIPGYNQYWIYFRCVQ